MAFGALGWHRGRFEIGSYDRAPIGADARRQNAAGFNPEGFGFRIAGSALIAAMLYSFARVTAVLKLKVDDYYHNGARRRLRLHEKGGKEHEMPVHHLLEETLNEYIAVAGLRSGQPLFQSVNSLGTAVTGRTLNRYNAWAAIGSGPGMRVF